MKKLKLIKEKELAVSIEQNYCDFCGENCMEVFTSSFDDTPVDTRKCVMQICHDCIRQLYKLIKS